MTVSWRTRVRESRGRWHVDLERHEGGRVQRSRMSTHDCRSRAEVARAEIRLDPAAHWREPRKRGPRAQAVAWSIEIRQSPYTGAWIVTLVRTPRGERKRSIVLRHCETREEADALRVTVRADPTAHWREPAEEPRRQIESKRRAAQERLQRAREALAEASHSGVPVRLDDGWWEMPCGLHEQPRFALHCATCEAAHRETLDRLERVALDAARAAALRTNAA